MKTHIDNSAAIEPWLAASAGLGLAMLLAACGASQSQTQADDGPTRAAVVHQGSLASIPAASPLRRSLQIEAAQEQVVERPVVVPGVVEADPARLVKLAPPVPGRVVELHKQLGDTVRAGEALFAIDSADLAQAHSDAAKAQAALVLAQHTLQRQHDLVQAGIAARKDLEQAESEHAQALSEAARTQARLAQIGLSPGQGSGRLYTLRSPVSGRVIEQGGARGGFWNDTNAPLLTVADLSTVWVAGTVRHVGDMLDADTRTVKVRIALDNRAGRYRPGMFAQVRFSGPAHPAVVVPAAALVQSGFDTRVFVEKSAWSFEPRTVKTGAQFGDRVELLAGLKAGERIVVKDGVLLND